MSGGLPNFERRTMRQLKLFIATSLDNFIAGKNGELDWLFSDDNDYGYNEFYNSIDTTLIGNKTYKQILTFGEFPYPNKTNFVFTRTHSNQDTKAVHFITDDLIEFVKSLKKQNGKDIWLVGGGEINTLMLNADLIDEMILSIHPIILAQGIPLFTDNAKRAHFKTKNCKTFESGLIQLTLMREK
jgi:dihydrofolate reductase